ncbi:hypothetical protein GCM10027445_11190 [Amycolatopsis endophytica]
MFFNVLTATFLPARSAAVLIGLSGLTTTAPKSLPCMPVEELPELTTFTGRPWDWASSSDVVLLKPNWNCPLITPGTIAAPPCAVSSVRSRCCSLKNPLLTPR